MASSPAKTPWQGGFVYCFSVIRDFDPTLVFRRGGPPKAGSGCWAAVNPEAVSRRAGLTKRLGLEVLENTSIEKRDRLMLTADFLDQGVHAATEHQLATFSTPVAVLALPGRHGVQ